MKSEHKNFYDQGWNAFIRGEVFDKLASIDWIVGWCNARDYTRDRGFIPNPI